MPAPRSTRTRVAALDELISAAGQQGDAIFLFFDFFRDADDHKLNGTNYNFGLTRLRSLNLEATLSKRRGKSITPELSCSHLARRRRKNRRAVKTPLTPFQAPEVLQKRPQLDLIAFGPFNQKPVGGNCIPLSPFLCRFPGWTSEWGRRNAFLPMRAGRFPLSAFCF